MDKTTVHGGFFTRNQVGFAPALKALAKLGTAFIGFCLIAASGCYHSVPVVADGTTGDVTTGEPAIGEREQGTAPDSTSGGSAARRMRQTQRCAAYFLVVENALPRPVEIYEVGQLSDRFVAYAQIDITELPMTESTQQFVAMSRGELMAASSANEHRPGDRVALQRGCRPS